MSRRRLLSDEQVRAVVADAKRGIPHARIARHFGVRPDVVTYIMSGRGYTDITGMKRRTYTPEPGQEPCSPDSPCARCRLDTTRDVNVTTAQALQADVRCVACDSAMTRPVEVVLKAGGLVRCEQCDGRRK